MRNSAFRLARFDPIDISEFAGDDQDPCNKIANNMHFDFVTLKTFLAVAETRNIRAASEQLNLSISAVSRRISELEADFGQQLFDRHSRGVEITDAGRLLAERTRTTFNALKLLKIDMDKLHTGEAGRVSISSNGSALVNGLATHIRKFIDLHPKIDIDIVEASTPEVLGSVDRGSVDIGFVAHTMTAPDTVRTVPYMKDRLVLAVPGSHQLAECTSIKFQDLLDTKVIGIDETSSLTRLVMKVSSMTDTRFAYSYMASTNEVARTMVANNLGVAILPERFVEPYLDLLKIVAVPIDEDWAKRELAIVVREDAPMTGPAKVFFDWIQSAVERSD